jgi:aspartyl-tRNA(Asn)/glutamyl-tRNA(Gln) amidotransferase subunit A
MHAGWMCRRLTEVAWMAEEFCFWTAVRLREAIAQREVSPVEVTRAVLDRATRLQPELNCFITLCPDEAMRDA